MRRRKPSTSLRTSSPATSCTIAFTLGWSTLPGGSLPLRDQTTSLAEAFRGYEKSVRESGACDEHLLRDRLLAGAGGDPLRRVLVTTADWIASASGLNGLYAADFDLLARIPGLQHI